MSAICFDAPSLLFKSQTLINITVYCTAFLVAAPMHQSTIALKSDRSHLLYVGSVHNDWHPVPSPVWSLSVSVHVCVCVCVCKRGEYIGTLSS